MTNETNITAAVRIVRLTRHGADAAQVAELQRIFGEVEVETKSVSLPSTPKEAVAEFDILVADATVVEAVLPVNLLEAVLKFSAFAKRGGKVIRSAMVRETKPDGEVVFTFSYYEEVKKIEVVVERL